MKHIITCLLLLSLSGCDRQETGLWQCVGKKTYDENGYLFGAIIDFDRAYFRQHTEPYDTDDPLGLDSAAKKIFQRFELDDFPYERIRFIDSDELRIRFVLSDDRGDEFEYNSYIKRVMPNALIGKAGIIDNDLGLRYEDEYDCFKQSTITLKEIISIAKDGALPARTQE